MSSCRSKNLPSAVRMIVPVSRPCRTFSRSWRCSDQQIRRVTQKTMTGTTNTSIRKRMVTSLIDNCRRMAMMSLPAANMSTT